MDTILMMLGAITLLFICIGVLLYWSGALTISVGDKKLSGKDNK